MYKQFQTSTSSKCHISGSQWEIHHQSPDLWIHPLHQIESTYVFVKLCARTKLGSAVQVWIMLLLLLCLFILPQMLSETNFSYCLALRKFVTQHPCWKQTSQNQTPLQFAVRHHQPTLLVVIKLKPCPPQKPFRAEAMSDWRWKQSITSCNCVWYQARKRR